MPPCFTVTGGQSFAELAGVRRICAGNPGDRALQNLPVSAGCVPGILEQGFAEFAGVRKDMCRESWDRALQNLPVSARICAWNPGTGLYRALQVSAGCVPGIRETGLYELHQKV